MAHAYTPGLKVTQKTWVSKKRLLPIKGKILVNEGDRVKANDVVAKASLPGKVYPLNIINKLGIEPSEIKDFMLLKEGDSFKKGDILAENKPIIKWFKTKITAPIEGYIENVSDITGQILLREPPKDLNLYAYIDGTISKVIPEEGVIIESAASFIQGIFGVGGETNGLIEVLVDSPEKTITPEQLNDSHKGKIIVAGKFAGTELFNKAKQVGVAGLVVGGIHDKDLKQLLGYDLGVAITGTENVGFTMVVTEGFSSIAISKKTFDLLVEKQGKKASISGATQIRAGVIRPEIIIPMPDVKKDEIKIVSIEEKGGMQPGDQLRIIREPYFGKICKVKSLPHELSKIESETMARVLEVEFPDNTNAIIPRANVELIEE